MNSNLLRGHIAGNGDRLQDLARKLDISVQSLSLKINNKVDWKLQEIVNIKKLYNLNASEVENIFLND